MFNHLDNNDKLTLTDLYRILKISRSDGWWGSKAIGKGLQGNTTKAIIRKALGEGNEDLLNFNLSKTDANLVDTQTGEVAQIISDSYLNEPLYRLWHLIYSISDKEECAKAIKKQFGITDQAIIENLVTIDFVKQGYANKSAKAMRRILPYLELESCYSKACLAAGFRHSESLTKQENLSRELEVKIKPIAKNELRQPVVEKILNQMINVVNALMEKHGRFDEIRVELARELKQSRDERSETTKAIKKAERENTAIADRIRSEYMLTPTRSRIQKYKMWKESDQLCFYCNQTVGVVEFLRGFDVEIEHIIPRSLFFDDGFSNKVCACRKCNKEKNNRTAYDYMKSKSESEFNSYIARIAQLYKERKISKTKYERLLTAGDKIPTDFIDRQLRESQYIAKKSRELLTTVCRDVTSTSGSVTNFVRRTWGYDRVLHNLNFDKYKSAGLTEIKEREHKDNSWSEEVIKDWSKRLDHRHHAIDALVIACTKQSYIQRINNMSELKDVNFAVDEKQGAAYQQRKSKLERYIEQQPHFSTTEVETVADSILVSFKAGKKAASTGKRYVHRGGERILVQKNIVVPRGALHEESIYGSIDRYAKNRKGETVIDKSFVLRYPITTIDSKTVDKIVDQGIKKLVQERIKNHIGNGKDIWKDMENNPLKFNGEPIKSVRRFAHLTSAKKLERGYVKLGNNHHIAIYIDPNGKRQESCVAFWSAVARKRAGVPIVITNPVQVWDTLRDGLPEEFLSDLPQPDWTFELSLQQNEMFVLGLEPEAFEEALSSKDYILLSKYLYRVQKLATKNYYFRHHLETSVDDEYSGVKNEMLSKKIGKVKVVCSFDALYKLHPQKVRISLLGEITKA